MRRTRTFARLLSGARLHRGRPLRARAGRRRAPAHRRAGRVRRSDARGAGWRRGAPHPRRLPHAGSRCRAAARREHARHVAAGAARRRSRPLVRAAGRARGRNDLAAGRDGDGCRASPCCASSASRARTAKCSSSSNSRSERVPARVLRPAGRGAGHRVLRVPAVRHPHRRRGDRRGRRALRRARCAGRRPRPHELVGVALPDDARQPHRPRPQRRGARRESAGSRVGRARLERGSGAPVRGRHVRRRDVLRLRRLSHRSRRGVPRSRARRAPGRTVRVHVLQPSLPDEGRARLAHGGRRHAHAHRQRVLRERRVASRRPSRSGAPRSTTAATRCTRSGHRCATDVSHTQVRAWCATPVRASVSRRRWSRASLPA